jgi:DnaK suppressor protein
MFMTASTLPTADELLEYRTALQQRLHMLHSDIASGRVRVEAQRDELQELHDLKDQAELNARSTVDDAELQRDLEEVTAIDAALARLQDGHYGECKACGEPIPRARLLVQPAAQRCATCQANHEKQSAALRR